MGTSGDLDHYVAGSVVSWLEVDMAKKPGRPLGQYGMHPRTDFLAG
jgi:hypothetical protein